MNTEVVSASSRARPTSGGFRTFFSWLRRDERLQDRTDSFESLSSTGSDRTVTSFAFLPPARYKTKSYIEPVILPPPGPPTDSYRKRIRDRNLRRHLDRNLTLGRKYQLPTADSSSIFDASSLPTARSLGDCHRLERGRRATSEYNQRRAPYVPGKRHAPPPPNRNSLHEPLNSTTYRKVRKRQAPQPPNQEINTNKETNSTMEQKHPKSNERQSSILFNQNQQLSDHKIKKYTDSTSNKSQSERNFLKHFFESKKRISVCDPYVVRHLPNISELDREAADILHRKWRNCNKNNEPTEDKSKDNLNVNNDDNSITIVSKNSYKHNYDEQNNIDEKQELKKMLKEMKDSLPKSTKGNAIINAIPSTSQIRQSQSNTPTLRIGSDENNIKEKSQWKDLHNISLMGNSLDNDILNKQIKVKPETIDNLISDVSNFNNGVRKKTTSQSTQCVRNDTNTGSSTNAHSSSYISALRISAEDERKANDKSELNKIPVINNVSFDIASSKLSDRKSLLPSINTSDIKKDEQSNILLGKNIKVKNQTIFHFSSTPNSSNIESKPKNGQEKSLKSLHTKVSNTGIQETKNICERLQNNITEPSISQIKYPFTNNNLLDKSTFKNNSQLKKGNDMIVCSSKVELRGSYNNVEDMSKHNTDSELSNGYNISLNKNTGIEKNTISNFVSIPISLNSNTSLLRFANKQEELKQSACPNEINNEIPKAKIVEDRSQSKSVTTTLGQSAREILPISTQNKNSIKPTVTSMNINDPPRNVNPAINLDNGNPIINTTIFNSQTTEQVTHHRHLVDELEQCIIKGDAQGAALAATRLAQLRLPGGIFTNFTQPNPSTSTKISEDTSTTNNFVKTKSVLQNQKKANDEQSTSTTLNSSQPNNATGVSPSYSKNVDSTIKFNTENELTVGKSVVSFEKIEETVVKDSTNTPAILTPETNTSLNCPVVPNISNSNVTVTSQNLEDKPLSINVWVEDREATHGPVRLQIARGSSLRILRTHAELTLGLPTHLQRWIVGRTLCTDDNTPLETIAGPDLETPFYLCLVEPDINKDAFQSTSNTGDIQHTNENNDTEPKSRNVYTELIQLEQRALVPNSETFECSVCIEDCKPGDGVVLRECVHMFCRECLAAAIRHCEEPIVTCLSTGCGGVLQEREIRALVSLDDYERWLAHGLAAAESGARHSFHCQTRDCTGWALCEPGVQRFPCPVCNHVNCVPCQAIHEGMTCEQHICKEQRAHTPDVSKVEDEGTRELLKELLKRGEALECPECNTIITKKWGCDWIKCSACKTEICWVTRGRRWGPAGRGDTSGGCRCGVDGKRCHPSCGYCH